MGFRIENRRYVGSKTKLMPWIKEEMNKHCKKCNSIFDVFAGTGVVSAYLIDEFDDFYINDFLYSNEVIYKAFFNKGKVDIEKLNKIKEEYNKIENIKNNYVSSNYGDKFFSRADAKKIGFIREDLENKLKLDFITENEFNILLASLLYSADRVAHTVGHYEAYIKSSHADCPFKFELIERINTAGKKIKIYREDANVLVKEVKADIAFIDPPYNSRQYSRFYHVLENITKWKKPKLTGTAMKPTPENMSEYCRNGAADAFKDLICNLNVKYIVVTYNNTYNSKSSSSKNKITLEEIESILNKKGKTDILNTPYKFFNAGKTDLKDHKEYLFITRVK